MGRGKGNAEEGEGKEIRKTVHCPQRKPEQALCQETAQVREDTSQHPEKNTAHKAEGGKGNQQNISQDSAPGEPVEESGRKETDTDRACQRK